MHVAYSLQGHEAGAGCALDRASFRVSVSTAQAGLTRVARHCVAPPQGRYFCERLLLALASRRKLPDSRFAKVKSRLLGAETKQDKNSRPGACGFSGIKGMAGFGRMGVSTERSVKSY